MRSKLQETKQQPSFNSRVQTFFTTLRLRLRQHTPKTPIQKFLLCIGLAFACILGFIVFCAIEVVLGIILFGGIWLLIKLTPAAILHAVNIFAPYFIWVLMGGMGIVSLLMGIQMLYNLIFGEEDERTISVDREISSKNS